ncbi:MAG: alpha/beta fold hydrolase, partial [Candidatus Heimdallarchaeaceae archaeon]
MLFDPFSEKRAELKIRRSGSWYNISYIDINENPLYDYTLICAHGWGSSSIIYSYLLKLLGPYFRIIAYD